VDTNAIRTRIQCLGWKLLEIPVKRNHPDANERKILMWKLVASKGGRSFEVGGSTIDEAMRNMGMTLGVISREMVI
jgi:hypothetical protein